MIVELSALKALLPKGKRLIGIDHGSKTWGLAVSSPDLMLATPLTTIKRTKFSLDIVKLATLCKEYGAAGFIIGLPLNMDGSSGPRVDSVRHFAQNLIDAKEVLGFEPVLAFFDERLSTYAVEDLMLTHDVSRKKRAAAVDKLAAATILQGALDKIRLTSV